MKNFILARTDERAEKSVGRILLYALVFFVVTRIGVMILIMLGTGFYMLRYGVNPMQELSFLGDPSVMAARMGWWAVCNVLLFAPLLEECAFRLGLSFRRGDVAVGLGALTAFVLSRLLAGAGVGHPFWWSVPAGLAVAALIVRFTTREGWLSRRSGWLRPMMWASALLFALAHLTAMQGLTWSLLPFALLLCLMLFFAGCVFVYLRVNLGFRWALGAHILNNIPATLMLLGLLGS